MLSLVAPVREEFHKVLLNYLLLLRPKEGRVSTWNAPSKAFCCYLTDKRVQLTYSEPDAVSLFPLLANLWVHWLFTHSGTRCTEHRR